MVSIENQNPIVEQFLECFVQAGLLQVKVGELLTVYHLEVTPSLLRSFIGASCCLFFCVAVSVTSRLVRPDEVLTACICLSTGMCRFLDRHGYFLLVPGVYGSELQADFVNASKCTGFDRVLLKPSRSSGAC